MLDRSRSFLALALAFACGCGSSISLVSPRRAVGGAPLFGPRPTTTQPTTTTPTSTPQNAQQYLNNLDAHLRAQGFQPAGNAIRNNAMPSTGLVAYAMDVQPGRCYSAIAVGDSGTDLNIVLLDPFGRSEAYNVLPDSTPHVTFCPRQAGRYIVRLQLSRGQGGYYYLAYQGPAGRDPNLQAFFQTGGSASTATATNTTPTPQTPRTAQLDPGTQGRVANVESTLTRDNFSRVTDPIGMILEQRQERLFPLNLSASACYAFATFGGPGTSDTDVFVVDGTGAELASDARSDVDAMVRFCPPSDGTYQLRTRLYSGAGPVFVAGWVQPRTLGGNVATNTTNPTNTTTTPDTTVIAGPSVAASGLRDAFALLDIDMQARGYAIQGEAADGSLASGETREFAISLERDKCYAIVALGESGVRNVDLTLVDAGGRTLDRESEVSGRAVVRICANDNSQRTVRLQMVDGSGAFKYATYQFTRGTRGPFGLAGLTWVRLSEVTALLDAERYSPSLDFSIETGRLTTVGRTVSQTLQLASGKCYAVVVVGGDGVSSVGVSLERSGRVLAENRTGSSFPDVRICTTEAGRYDLRIASAAGTGAYAYEVFERASQ